MIGRAIKQWVLLSVLSMAAFLGTFLITGAIATPIADSGCHSADGCYTDCAPAMFRVSDEVGFVAGVAAVDPIYFTYCIGGEPYPGTYCYPYNPPDDYCGILAFYYLGPSNTQRCDENDEPDFQRTVRRNDMRACYEN